MGFLIIVIGLLLIVLIITRFVMQSNAKWCANFFMTRNTLTWGPKRFGKGLFWAKMHEIINKPYYYVMTNFTNHNDKGEEIFIKDMNIAPNTYSDVIDGNIKVMQRKWIEKKDIWVDDAGNMLPSYAHKEITQKYPSLPNFMMLQGHIADSNTHFNYNGVFTRLYDKAREQADVAFRILSNIKLPFIILVKVRYYELLTTAELGLPPYAPNKFLDSKQNKALRNQYYAQNGLIKDMWIYVVKNKLHYDSRSYEKKLFGSQGRIYISKKLSRLSKLNIKRMVKPLFKK